MTGAEILILLVQNAPAILATVEDVADWAIKTWASVKASYDQDPSTITKEQLLAQLDRIKAKSDEIQAIK